MINNNEAYFLGLLYSKGDIIELPNNKIQFLLNIKFRRPDDESVRSDNIYTPAITHEGGKEKLGSRFSNDFFLIKTMLVHEFLVGFDLVLDEAGGVDWNKKAISIISEEIDNNNPRFIRLFGVDKIDSTTLRKFPFSLEIENNKQLSLSFVQGVCDGCSLVPNEASSQNGGEGAPRIQLEPNQDRWELCIGLCLIFQLGLNIRVNNINWGHPQIRTSWKGQNHQFRVSLSDIPPEISLYRLEYKQEEYNNLYERMGVIYEPSTHLCPEKKKGVIEGMDLYINSSEQADLNNALLHKNLLGIDIDIPRKKSLIICYLLGCQRCREFINIYLDGKLI